MNDDFLDLSHSPDGSKLGKMVAWHLIVHNPHYGPGGCPYTVMATFNGHAVKESYHTSREALERRDQLLDQGFPHVIVLGLPTVLFGSMPEGGDP